MEAGEKYEEEKEEEGLGLLHHLLRGQPKRHVSSWRRRTSRSRRRRSRYYKREVRGGIGRSAGAREGIWSV